MNHPSLLRHHPLIRSRDPSSDEPPHLRAPEPPRMSELQLLFGSDDEPRPLSRWPRR